jgi:hypothetical protein
MRQVYLRWVDSCALGIGERWTNKEDLDTTKGETICESIGWLVEQNDHSLYVAGHISPEEYGSVWQIPRVAVKELNYLEPDEADERTGEDWAGQVHPVHGLGS